jgi:hypothetical protein
VPQRILTRRTHQFVFPLLFVAMAIGASADAEAPPPAQPHPRILLDNDLRAAWRAAAKQSRGPVKGAIALCTDASDSARYDRGLYRGMQWTTVLQACLVAWAATDELQFADTAIRFFTALLDDQDRIGDGLGGDAAARQDSGYAIRTHGPYTALGYDWLHAYLSPELKARARQRWSAWLSWYRDHGYRARFPGSNYHAGYLYAATMIAIAQAGEAGPEGDALWSFVADELWGKDMAAALAPGGILDGGDWPEGWQYGPLAVASYSLSARVARRAGIAIDGIERWLAAVLRRHVHGLSPADGVYVGGDTEFTTPNLQPHVNTLNAIAFGDAAPEDRRYAKGELLRLRLIDRDFLLLDALASVGDPPAEVPRGQWPRSYIATGTGTFFARTRWDERAVWFVAECQHSLDLDHRHPKAGSFVLSRGADDLIVDPSPYGSQSTLTSNAPTVVSRQFPDHYKPSQAVWGKSTGWVWTTQAASGVVAARCSYADQYRFQDKPSDIPEAVRDFVLLPNGDGSDAALVIVDRAVTNDDQHGMHLRFRVPGALQLAAHQNAAARIGRTQLAIEQLRSSGGTTTAGQTALRTCYAKGIKRGQCDAARFDVSEVRVSLAGPAPYATHVIKATGSAHRTNTLAIGGEGWDGVYVSGAPASVVVVPRNTHRPLTYEVPGNKETRHVILGLTEGITATRAADSCRVTVGPAAHAGVAIVVLDSSCNVRVDTRAAGRTPSAPPRSTRVKRAGGCCDRQGAGATPIASSLVIGALMLRRRRRATR